MDDSAAKEAAPGPAEAASGHVPAALSVSAALIDSSHTGSLKVQQVRNIVHKHEGMLQSEHSAAAKAMQQVQKIVEGHKAVIQSEHSAATASTDEEKMQSVQLELTSLSKVRKALESLTSFALKQELTKHLAAETNDAPVVNIPIKCGTTFLKSYAQDFGAQRFVDGFPRGDCQEKATGRKRPFTALIGQKNCLAWPTSLGFAFTRSSRLLLSSFWCGAIR